MKPRLISVHQTQCPVVDFLACLPRVRALGQDSRTGSRLWYTTCMLAIRSPTPWTNLDALYPVHRWRPVGWIFLNQKAIAFTDPLSPAPQNDPHVVHGQETGRSPRLAGLPVREMNKKVGLFNAQSSGLESAFTKAISLVCVCVCGFCGSTST